MRIYTSAICCAVAALSLGGCATQKYVDEQIAGVNSRVGALDSRVGALEGKVAQNASRLDAMDSTIANANRFATTVISESDQVSFDTNQWTLSTEAQSTLTAFAERLKSENKRVYIEIVGHGDPRGSVNFNRVLAGKRALEVRRFLSSQGIPLAVMDAVSWGEEHPTATDNASNRIVVLRVLG